MKTKDFSIWLTQKYREKMISRRVSYSPSLKWSSSIRPTQCLLIRRYSRVTKTDEYGIPTAPTWSVTSLLSSYPRPLISSQTLNHLHKLAALIPPTQDTPEYEKLRKEVSELIRLVGAVRLVDTSGILVSARWGEEDADRQNAELPLQDISEGQELLKHAARVENGFYLVDADRKKSIS